MKEGADISITKIDKWDVSEDQGYSFEMLPNTKASLYAVYGDGENNAGEHFCFKTEVTTS